MVKAIIFDLDGVLIESEIYFLKAEIAIFNNHGMKLDEETAAKYLGLKIDAYIAAMEKIFNKKLDHKQLAREIEEMVHNVYQHKIPLVPNVAKILPKLAKTYKLVLATSREKYLAEIVMKRLNIAKYFPNGVYREHVSIGKPNPEVFLSAAKLVGVEPKDCVVVEDAQAGFEAGKAAGIYVIGRKAGYNKHQDFSAADATFTDFSKLPGIISSIK
ncbi:MAG TPA: HAD family phosphatase [Candidatus Saccharimonadales bacterium]|nr:HAD family phosphatase [Candidatus Saccharimonadales bacterium]